MRFHIVKSEKEIVDRTWCTRVEIFIDSSRYSTTSSYRRDLKIRVTEMKMKSFEKFLSISTCYGYIIVCFFFNVEIQPGWNLILFPTNYKSGWEKKKTTTEPIHLFQIRGYTIIAFHHTIFQRTLRLSANKMIVFIGNRIHARQESSI